MRILKRFSLTSNAKLAERAEHQIGTQWSQVTVKVTYFDEILFAISYVSL